MDEENSAELLVGKSVRKFFQGYGFFGGKVVSYDKSTRYFRVKYGDGDREEVELHELMGILVSGAGCDDGGEAAPPKRSRGRPRKDEKDAKRRKGGKNGEGLDYRELVAMEVAKALRKQRLELGGEERRPRGRPRKKPRLEERMESLTRTGEVYGREARDDGKEEKKDEEDDDKALKSVAHRRKSSLVDRGAFFQQRRRLEERPVNGGGNEKVAEKTAGPDLRTQGTPPPDRVKAGDDVPRQEVECPKMDETDLNVPALPPSALNINVPTESIFQLFSVYTFLRSFSWVIFLSPFTLQELVRCLTLKEANPLIDQIHLSLLLLLRQHLESLASDGNESAVNCLRCRDWTLLDAVTWPSYLIACLVNGNYRKEGKDKLLKIGILRKEYYTLEVSSKVDILSFLCDRLLDTEEVRSELGSRSNGDVELDMPQDGSTELSTKRETRRTRKGSPVDTLELVEPAQTPDFNSDDCVLCGMDGNLICCDGCPAAYHSRCVGVAKSTLPEGDWFCPECTLQKIASEGPKSRKVVRGFDYLGVDVYGRRYIAACEHFFISESLSLDASYVCYGPGEVSAVVQILDSGEALSVALKATILQRWNISDNSVKVVETPRSPVQQDMVCVLNGSTDGELYATAGPGSSKPSRAAVESVFEAPSYVNQYAQGGLSALAASNLAENSSNRRAAVQKAQIFEQIKAFSRGPVQFCWPSLKRRRMEAPKDRCGWCFACKNLSRKKGCLLNTAAGKLSAGAGIVSGWLRLTKRGINHLPTLTAYMLYMEDRLHGLLEGLWESTGHRNRWRRGVDCAAHVCQVKSSLYELGSSLRPLALFKDWSVYAEDAPRLGSVNGNIFVSSFKKSVGRRRKKVQADDPIKIYPGGGTCGVQWRRGGKLVRRFLDWETLPVSALKRASRQGGMKKIPELLYNDYFELPRRTVQCAWLARVESSFSISELAIQIRSLDALIRWSDLSIPPEVKASFGEFIIKEKAIQDDTTKYLLDASKTEEEITNALTPEVVSCAAKFVKTLVGEEGGSLKSVWLPETDLPVCLVREFEEKRRRIQQQPKKQALGRKAHPGDRRASKSSKFKAILNRLHSAVGKTKTLICEQCNLDMDASDLANCQECQGEFHKHCLTGNKSNRICQSCFVIKQSSRRSRRLVETVTVEETPVIREKPPLLVYSRRKKPAVTLPIYRATIVRRKRSKRRSGSGVRWKLGKQLSFRRDKVVYPTTKPDGNVRCGVCLQDYDPRLLYIGCEHCQEWFHGRAVGVTISNIARVEFFQCYKCRKAADPYCPYSRGD